MRKVKEEKYIPRSGGLLIGENLKINVANNKRISELLKLWIIAALGIFSTLHCIFSLYNIRCDTNMVGFVTFISFAISAFVFSTKRYRILSAVQILIMVALFLLIPKDELFLGFKRFINYIVDEAKLESYDIVGFYIPRKLSPFDAVTLFMCIFGALTSFAVCFAVVAKKNFALSFVFTFPLIELGLFFGIAPDYRSFAAVLAFWIAVAVLNNSNYCEYIGKKGSDFVRKGNSFMPKFGMKKRVDVSSAMCAVAITLMVFGCSVGVISAFDLKRPKSVDDLRYALKHDLTDLTLKDVINMLSGNSPDTNYGNIGNSGNLEYEDKDMLHMTFSDKMNTNVYFKSYVGSVYDSSSWSEFDEDVLEELENVENVCNPQNMLWYFMRSNFTDLPKVSVDVDVIDAPTDFCYTPYCSEPKKNSQYIADTAVLIDSIVIGDSDYKASYSYDFIPSNPETIIQWYCDGNKDSKALYLDSHEYDNFVYDNYLWVPQNNELLSLMDNDEYAEIIENHLNGIADIYETLCAIRSVIHDNARYTLKPGETPSGVDFVYYFLEENHEGYCVHYASAGVILARMAGIPARYCVGYVAPTSKFNLMNKTGSGYDFILKDDSAHAWAEIYLEGVGWIPFEFTEGYDQPQQTTASTTVTTTVTTTTTKRSSTLKTTSRSLTATTTTTTTSASVILNEDDKSNNTAAYIIIASVIALALLVLFIMWNARRLALNRLNRSMNSHDGNKNAVNAYRYIISLLEFDGVNLGSHTLLEHAYLAQDKCGYIEKDSLVFACNSAMKAQFGNKTDLSEAETQSICNLAFKLANEIYNSKSFADRLKMKYIERLI